MASRMERYYQEESNLSKRTKKNEELYRALHDDSEYNNVEGIATIDSDKPIDIEDVRKLIQSRENNSRNIVKPEAPLEKSLYYEEEVKSYDINDMIDKARDVKPEEFKPRSLGETQIISLKDLIDKKDKKVPKEDPSDDIKELINTIYTTSILKSDGDGGLFDDLKSSGNTVVEPSIQKVISKAKEEDIHIDQDEDTIDKSFYTSSLGFKKNDFEKIQEMEDSVKKSNKVTTIFLVILATIFIIATVYIVIRFFFI